MKTYEIKNDGKSVILEGPEVSNWQDFLKETFQKEVAPSFKKKGSGEEKFQALLNALSEKGYIKVEQEQIPSASFSNNWGSGHYQPHPRQGFKPLLFKEVENREFKEIFKNGGLTEKQCKLFDDRGRLKDDDIYCYIPVSEDTDMWEDIFKRNFGLQDINTTLTGGLNFFFGNYCLAGEFVSRVVCVDVDEYEGENNTETKEYVDLLRQFDF